MWASAPGPIPAESEMEEGGEDEGSRRQGAATARTGQVELGLRTRQSSFSGQFLLSLARKTNSKAFPTLLFIPTTPTPTP